MSNDIIYRSMKSLFIYNKKPLYRALSFFSVSFCSLIFFSVLFDFTEDELRGVFFLTIILCCVLLAKNAFDSATKEELSSRLKNTMAPDLAVTSEGLHKQLYKNSPVPYMIIDAEGFIKSANVAAIRTLGIRSMKVNEINIFDWIQCDKVDHLDMLIGKYNNGVAITDERVRVNRPDHGEVWAVLSLFNFLDNFDNKVGLLTLVDITKQKKAEDAKSEFVSLASHQLRTPIAGMRWSAELLLMDTPKNLSSRQSKYIDRLLVSINRMAVLVDDFLRVSRFELGTFQAEYKPVDLSELFEDVLEDHVSKAKQKGLKVKTFFDKSVNTVMTDQNLVRMIVTNLYSNAVKYTRKKGTIHIGFGSKDGNLVITVADNGIGIPENDKGQIFSKLFRASNAVRDVPDGTGLGLYIMKEAVTVLRGGVSYTTTENTGTTFEIVLPLKLPE